MKRILKYAVISMVSILFYFPVHAVTEPPLYFESTPSLTHVPSSFTIEQIINLTPKEYKNVTGKKMRFGQVLSLKYVQHKIKKQIKQGEPVNVQMVNQDIDATDFSFAGFLLGFLLSIFGVLIAYLIGDRRKIKWSWYGFGFGAIIILLVLIL